MPLTGYRVLVVEDEVLIAHDLTEAIEAAGGEVVGPVATLSDAIQTVRDDFEFAVLDIKLRGGAVFPIADALHDQGVPFVFATGYGAQAIPPRWSTVPRWEKPFSALELVAFLEMEFGPNARSSKGPAA